MVQAVYRECGRKCFENDHKIAPKCRPGGLKIAPKCLLGASRRPPKAQPTTETLCKSFFTLLGRSWRLLGLSWGCLGAILEPRAAPAASWGAPAPPGPSRGLSLAPGTLQEAPKAREINKIMKSIVFYEVSAGKPAFVWWSHGNSLAFSVFWWSYVKSFVFSVSRLVLRSISRVFVVWWSYAKSLAFSVPRLVLR